MRAVHRRRSGHVMAVVGLALVASACGGSESSGTSVASSTTAATTPAPTSTAAPVTTTSSTTTSSTTTPATTTPAPSTTAATTTTTEPCAVFTDTDVTTPGFPGQMSSLIGADVRAGAHACFERVVFELQGTGAFPGYRVRYEDPPLIDDPRGEPVAVAGSAFIVVTIESWMTTMEGEGYHGPLRFTPTSVAHVKELVQLGNFEGMTTWAIGVDGKRPFQVATLDNPPRLVIDIGNP